MTQTKDQQAQEYAEKKDRAMRKAWYEYRFGPIREYDDWENHPVKPSDNFEKGFMAGYTACEQSLWRSVEEELPEFGQKVIVRASCESINGKQYEIHESLKFESIKSFGNTFKLRERANKGIKYKITHFMYIPSLPDTNTEKI